MKKRFDFEFKGYVEMDIITQDEENIKDATFMFEYIKKTMEAELLKSKAGFIDVKEHSIPNEFIFNAKLDGFIK